jgi:hypothetical protein
MTQFRLAFRRHSYFAYCDTQSKEQRVDHLTATYVDLALRCSV